MVCNPQANSINIPPPGPPPQIPGLGKPITVPRLPLPDTIFPEGLPEDLLELMDKISALLPTGILLQPNPDSLMKTVMDAIANLFNELAPFLAFYKFIQALLNIILCIIDVICALLNPFALPGAVLKLFKQCIPDFLSLFPFMALIIMILTLLLLLIALIVYMYNVIKDYIEQIIANIKRLEQAFQFGDTDGILACVKKIAFLLCLLQNLFAILIAIQALFAIIKPLMELSGMGVCSENDACCGPDFCPAFIRQNPDGILSKNGMLLYYKQLNQQYPADPIYDVFKSSPSVLRQESWQFFDSTSQTDLTNFGAIISPSANLGLTYWPEGSVYDSASKPVMVPYLLDMTLKVNPVAFGHTDDRFGMRTFNIRDIIVLQKPQNGVSIYQNNSAGLSGPFNGTLILGGGTVWEKVEENTDLSGKTVIDGYVPYQINGKQATLNTFITQSPETALSLPTYNDGYYIADVNYRFRWNSPVLIGKQLVSMMCNPILAGESAIVNSQNDNRPTSAKITWPDIPTTLANITQCIEKFRKNINEESANELQTCLLNNLQDLQNQASNSYCEGAVNAADRYSSDVSVSPTIQFVNIPIKVRVTIKDRSGTVLASNVPQDVGTCIASHISAKSVIGPNGEVTLGTIGNFTYDGYQDFVADLNSDKPGIGYLHAYVNNQSIARINGRDDLTVSSSIEEQYIKYEFVDGVRPTSHRTIVSEEHGGDSIANRFTESDI